MLAGLALRSGAEVHPLDSATNEKVDSFLTHGSAIVAYAHDVQVAENHELPRVTPDRSAAFRGKAFGESESLRDVNGEQPEEGHATDIRRGYHRRGQKRQEPPSPNGKNGDFPKCD